MVRRVRGVGVALVFAAVLASAPHAAADRLSDAIAAYERQGPQEAYALLQQLIADEPGNDRAIWNLGLFAMAEKRHEEAIGHFERAIEVDDGVSDYHLWRGYAYARRAHRVNPIRRTLMARKIRESFELAVTLDPDSIAARKALRGYYLEAPFFLGGSRARAAAQTREILRLEEGLGDGGRDLGGPVVPR